MGNQQQGGAGGGGLGQFIPHKSALSTLVVKVWRLQHPYSSAEAEEEEEGGEELEGRDDEVVIVLRYGTVRVVATDWHRSSEWRWVSPYGTRA